MIILILSTTTLHPSTALPSVIYASTFYELFSFYSLALYVFVCGLTSSINHPHARVDPIDYPSPLL